MAAGSHSLRISFNISTLLIGISFDSLGSDRIERFFGGSGQPGSRIEWTRTVHSGLNGNRSIEIMVMNLKPKRYGMLLQIGEIKMNDPKKDIKTTGSFVGNTFRTSRKKLENMNLETGDIQERQQLLEWLKYNDFMYFEKIHKSANIDCREEYWFQQYIHMPLDQLRKKVKFINSLNDGSSDKSEL